MGYYILIIIAVILLRIILPSKGKMAEKMVHHKLMDLDDNYHVIDDALFLSNGRSTQIDHIVVSPYGIFVIETKGYAGWISGGDNNEYWTQNIYGNKTNFYNPIRQNAGHVRFLNYLLRDLGNIPIIPIVVFNNEARLNINVTQHIVVNRCYLSHAITQYRQVVISEELKQRIIARINEHLTFGKEAVNEHKQQVYLRQNQPESKIRHGICPRCGGQLVLRNSKYGKFYGCSNYPKCKFTMNARG